MPKSTALAALVAVVLMAAGAAAQPLAEASTGAAGPRVEVTSFGNVVSSPAGITAGPDGALWFTNFGGDSIGRITTTGTVTAYRHTSIDFPEWITAGPDGALWFTNDDGDSIGRLRILKTR